MLVLKQQAAGVLHKECRDAAEGVGKASGGIHNGLAEPGAKIFLSSENRLEEASQA